MRVLHTSDWHLGHTLHHHDRLHEHQAFIAWFLDQVGAERVDAVLLCGDIFDTANPSAAAQALWYRFVAELHRRYPIVELVIIGGNHDSGARLDAPAPLLQGQRAQIRGAVDPRAPLDDLVIPLTDADGAVQAWVAAVPFLRPVDLPKVDDADGDPLILGVQALYDSVLDLARAKRQPHQALIALGHAYLQGTQLSELSERRILGGNQHAIPVAIFPDDVSYVALGHLHLAQRVGQERVRYSGSPIPLSISERRYTHQVLCVDFDGGALAQVRSLPVPRLVDLLRVPERDALSPDELVLALGALPPADDTPHSTWPLVDVVARLSEPMPELRSVVEGALQGRRARLLRVSAPSTGTGQALGDLTELPPVNAITPEMLFERLWARHYDEPPSEQVWADFHELVIAAENKEQA